MNRITRIVLVCLALLPPLAHSGDICTTWGCISHISELVTNHAGKIRIATPLDETLANCDAVSGVYFSLDPNAQNFKEMYAAVLAAYMSGKKIQLRVQEGSSECTLSYVRFSSGF
ncbi:MAG: hypothetical protein MK096_14990 [Oleiphilaceae bacterium]|nr:hypothetical protein [Oleiphilaceae bacterium]